MNSSCLEWACRKAEPAPGKSFVKFTPKIARPNRSPRIRFSRPAIREANGSGKFDGLGRGATWAATTAMGVSWSFLMISDVLNRNVEVRRLERSAGTTTAACGRLSRLPGQVDSLRRLSLFNVETR